MLSNFRNYVVTLLRDRSGGDLFEYALIIAFSAVFIIAGALAIDHFLKIFS